MNRINHKKLLRKILKSRKNINFNDFAALVSAFGFTLARIEGSHHIYKHQQIFEIINLQNVNGEAKPYQIKQFLVLVEKYHLELGE